MANGTRTGAHGRARRNGLPRVHSVEGVTVRVNLRRAAAVVTRGTKWDRGYKVPGSRNPHKVGRG